MIKALKYWNGIDCSGNHNRAIQILETKIRQCKEEFILSAETIDRLSLMLAGTLTKAGADTHVLILLFTGKKKDIKIGTWAIAALFSIMFFVTH